MRCLIVSPSFPPQKGVGTVRMASLVSFLKKEGIDCTVLTNSICGEKVIDVDYYYVDILEGNYRYYQRFNENEKRYKMAFREAIKKYVIDIVIISGGPFYSFAIAKEAKINKIPCVLDFRDPWIFEYRGLKNFLKLDNLYSKFIEIPKERSAVNNSDYVITVTDGWKRKFKLLYPFKRKKFGTIQNGYDDEILNNLNSFETPEHEKIVLASFGKLFYYSERYSDIFLAAFCDCDNVKLLQVGEREECKELLAKYDIDNNLFSSTGFLPYLSGVNELNKADAFLIIDIRKDAIGTKIYDYIYLNKPIIYIGPRNTTIAKILKQFKNAFICCNRQQVVEAIHSIKHNMKLDNNINVSMYARSAQNKKWKKLITKMLG